MKSMGKSASRFAAIITSVAALAMLGGAAYAAGRPGPSATAASAAPSVTTFRWHNIGLTDGWSTYGAQNLGSPGYAIVNGVVYLRGAMSGGFGAAFATLPKAARPARDLWTSTVTLGPTNGALQVQHNGTLAAFGSNATGFTSLSGISYPLSE